MEAKVVINTDYGGFNLTAKALKELGKLKFPKDVEFLDKIPEEYFSDGNWLGYKDESERLKFESIKDYLARFEYGSCDRTDKDLVKVVENLGEEASPEFTSLEVKTIFSASGRYQIHEYDGYEKVSAAEDVVFDKMYKEPEIHDTLEKNELYIMLATAKAIKDLENRTAIIKDRYFEMCKMQKTGLYDKEKFEGAYLAIKNSLDNVKPFDMRISETKVYVLEKLLKKKEDVREEEKAKLFR